MIRVGMSGWTYAPWRGKFYPKGLVQKKELEWASRQVSSIEINGTFYSLQKPASFENWYAQSPDDFRFAVKAPKFMTHVLRLKEAREPLCSFLASGLLCLKQKLGPILWQLPPQVTLKDDRFEKFVKMLPHTSREAAELAKGHSPKLKGRVHCETDGEYPVRHAFEFRHESFRNAEFLEMLRAHRVGAVFADSGLKSPYLEDLCSDFVYLRMHGENKKFGKGYPDEYLDRLVKRVRLWESGQSPADAACVSPSGPFPGKKDVFIYFDNEKKENAPQDALRLLTKLSAK